MKKALALLALSALSCSKPAPQKAAEPTAAPAPAQAPRQYIDEEAAARESADPAAELTRLEQDIERQLARLGLAPATDERPSPVPLEATPTIKDKASKEAGAGTARPEPPPADPGTTCEQTCKVVKSICDASERICEIAERLPPDSGAPQRCERAEAACESAREKGESCGCQ